MNTGKPCILVIGDTTPPQRRFCLTLRTDGYDVLKVSSYSRGVAMAYGHRPDLILLDLDLAGAMDGFAFCTMIRQSINAPIIAVSEKTHVSYKVRALDLGADDYLAKPWGQDELYARIRACLRRVNAGREQMLREDVILHSHDHALFMDVARRQVRLGGQTLQLTPKEFKMLHTLMLYAGKVLTHGFLLHQVWGDGYNVETDYVRVCICQLRKKLADDYIITQRSVGYLFRDGSIADYEKTLV